MFISIEGIDGCGKTTQAQNLINKLPNIKYFREPGGTQVGEAIRDIVLSPKFENVAPTTEALLYATSRAQLVFEVIEPLLADEYTIVCDRFIDSSIAYQAIGRDLSIDDVRNINLFATKGFLPDITFLIDLEGKTGFSRVTKQGELDRIEQEGVIFYEKVRQAFLSLAKKEPTRFCILDGNKSAAALSLEIENILSERFGMKFS